MTLNCPRIFSIALNVAQPYRLALHILVLWRTTMTNASCTQKLELITIILVNLNSMLYIQKQHFLVLYLAAVQDKSPTKIYAHLIRAR